MKSLALLRYFIFFIAGSVTAVLFGWWQPIVTVNIKNLSDQQIDQIEFEFETTQGHGFFNLNLDKPMRKGDMTEFKLYVLSEGAISMKVVFENSKTLNQILGYVDSGDKKFFQIGENSITSIK